MKKILIVTALCALILSFTACKKDEENVKDVFIPDNSQVQEENNKIENNSSKEDEKNIIAPEASQKPELKPDVPEKPAEEPEKTPEPSKKPEVVQEPQATQEPEIDESTEDVVSKAMEDLVSFINKDGNIGIRMPFNQKISDTTSETYIGLSSEDFKNFVDDSVVCESMIMPSNHSMCIIKLKDTSNVSDIKNKIFNNCNPRKWVCMSAEYVLVADSDNYIVLAMSTKENCKAIYDSFSKNFGSASTALEKAIEE